MKIVVWIGSGANQKALVNKINKIFPIDTIIIEHGTGKKKRNLFNLFQSFIIRLFYPIGISTWRSLMSYYETAFPKLPACKIVTVENINSEEAFKATVNANPDLIIVSGTKMIKKNMLGINPIKGILNLHTGLSPYVKGGPNCTNWCISTGQFHLIGNTVMWIDEGIDSGKIVTTELTKFTGNESFFEIHKTVMEHAHELYIKAIKAVLTKTISGVQQHSITEGKTYYTKDWNLSSQANLKRGFQNFKTVVNSQGYKEKQESLITVDL